MMPPEVQAALQRRRVATAVERHARLPVGSDPDDDMPDLVTADTARANQVAANPARATRVSSRASMNPEARATTEDREEYLTRRRTEALAGQAARYLPPISDPPPPRDGRYPGGSSQIFARTTSMVTTWNQAEYTHAHPMLERRSPPPASAVERIATSTGTQTTSTDSNTISHPLVATPISTTNTAIRAASQAVARAVTQARLRPAIYNPSIRRPTGILPLQAPQPPSRLPPHRYSFNESYRTPRRRARSPRATAASTARYQQVIRRRLEERARAETAHLDPETRSEALQHPLNPSHPTPLNSALGRRTESVADAGIEAYPGRANGDLLQRLAAPGELNFLDTRETESAQPYSEHIEDTLTEHEPLPPTSQQIRDLRGQQLFVNPFSNRTIDPGTEHDYTDYITAPILGGPQPTSLQPPNPVQPARPSWAARRHAEQAEERQRERHRGLLPEPDDTHPGYWPSINPRPPGLRPALYPPPQGLRPEDYEAFVAMMPEGQGPTPSEWRLMLDMSPLTTEVGSWAARRRRRLQRTERNRGLDAAPVYVPVSVPVAAAIRTRDPGMAVPSATAEAFRASSSTGAYYNDNNNNISNEAPTQEETAVAQTEAGIRRRDRVRDALVGGRVMGEEEYRRRVDDAVMRDQEWEEISRVVARRGLGVRGPMGWGMAGGECGLDGAEAARAA